MADVLTSFPSNDGFGRWMILTADEKHLVIGASLSGSYPTKPAPLSGNHAG